MSSLPPSQTERQPALPEQPGPSSLLARELRARPEPLDEVTRARMERSLVQAWRTHGAARVPLPSSSRRPGRSLRGVWAASLAASAVAGALLAFHVVSRDRAQAPVTPAAGRFELRIGDGAVQSGAVAESQVLESGSHGHIDVDLGSASVRMEHDTRLRFDRLSEPEIALSVLKGRVDVDFHPRHKGEARMVVESLAARVLVVGTRFRVEVDGLGNTQVSVREGVVEVVPHSGAPTRRVAAGQSTYVRADEGDDYERAVRAAIEHNLDTIATPEPPRAAAEREDEAGSQSEAEPSATAPGAKAIAHRLELARRLLRHGQHKAARARLRGLTEAPTAQRFRVEALTLTAESYTAQGDIPAASQAYRRADAIAPTGASGNNARFALARLLERYAHDRAAAATAYHRYLERAPQGALASQAKQALCRLGETTYCE
ncbi:MAG: FecR domain-containing protein [Polyangiales bacterium]